MSDVITVVDARSRDEQREAPLYAGRVEVYPMRVRGTFRRVKWTILSVLLGIYYVIPWLRWDRGESAPDQAVLIDITGQRLYFFWIEIWPQEVYFLTGVLILAAFGLFLATSLLGRVWCGYTCPQTVWTDLFMWVERMIEGDRNARIRLDKQPMSAAKALRKTAKHAVWLVIAAATGGAWVVYFNDAPTVTAAIFTGQAGAGVYFFCALFTATTYLLAGWAREQVCTYMCPWPRIQAGLFDEDTLAVTYQGWRGEPRGKHRKDTSWDDRGDCVDCKRCVAVCPTGIDIRDGFQIECIGCSLCIDACNDIMSKVGRPGQLITYDSIRNQQLRAEDKAPSYRLIRPRTIIYATLLVAVGVLMVVLLALRGSSDITVQADRNPLFVTLADGSIRNGYTIKILNKTHAQRRFDLALAEDGSVLSVLGQEPGADGEIILEAMPDSVATFKAYVQFPARALSSSSMPLTFLLTDSDGIQVGHDSVFRGPSP